MSDKITILRHPTNLLTKTWLADGTVKPYDDAKYFVHREVEVENLGHLSAVLEGLAEDKQACVIRGLYVGHDKAATLDPEYRPNRVRRIADLYDDAPHHWALIEIDEFEPLTADPVLHPVEAIDEYIATHLPSCFAGVSYHWQLSNSAGHPTKAGKLKAHVWFWLETAYTSEQLRAWATTFDVALDRSVFNVVQIHYTAEPAFEAGVADPVPTRSGYVEGFLSDAVPLAIDSAILEAAGSKRSSRHQRLMTVAENDPVAQRLAERGLVKSVGKKGELFIECPRSEHHTSESSETSTAYYPAHTGGYARGAFVCKHEHCQGVPHSVFLSAIGINPIGDGLFDDMVEDGEDDEAEGQGGADGGAGAGSAGAGGGAARKPKKKKRAKIPEARHLTTDQANALRILNRYGLTLMVSSDRWFAWVGTHWAADDAAVYRFVLNLSALIHAEADQWRAKPAANDEERALNESVANALAKWAAKSEMRSTIEAALALAKKMLTVNPDDLNADPWALNCQNGTVDLRTGKLRPHNPDDYITHCIPLNYVEGARSELFETMVARVTCEEGAEHKPLAGFLQRWFGYCATGSTREQKFATHYGTGRNGKSTLLDTVAEVMNGYAATAAPGLMMSKGSERHPTEIADLNGRRMVTAHETGEGGVLREDFVKQATGSDKLKARFMRGDFFEFAPTHKLQLVTNYKPVIKGQDPGIWRRVMLVPYRARFGTVEEVATGKATCVRDTTIMEKLALEKEAVLAWVVAGAVEWYRDGLNPPDVVLAASKDYQIEQDRMAQFIAEECELGAELSEKLSTPWGGGLYPSYVSWCKDGGIHSLSKQRFLQELERVVPGYRKGDKYETGEDAKKRKFAVIYGLRLVESDYS